MAHSFSLAQFALLSRAEPQDGCNSLPTEAGFALVHLSSGKLLGGYWGANSYAGSFPNDGDIYLEACTR